MVDPSDTITCHMWINPIGTLRILAALGDVTRAYTLDSTTNHFRRIRHTSTPSDIITEFRSWGTTVYAPTTTYRALATIAWTTDLLSRQHYLAASARLDHLTACKILTDEHHIHALTVAHTACLARDSATAYATLAHLTGALRPQPREKSRT